MKTFKRRSRVSFGLFSLAICLLCFGAGGCKEDTATYYQGYLEAEYVYIASENGGVLQRLAVKRGDWVDADAPLFQLDPTPVQARRDQRAAQLDQAKAQTADLAQPLARPSELAAKQAAVEQQQAARDLSAVEAKRQRELMRDNATTEDNYDQARFAYQQNAAALKQAEAQLETAQLSARTNQILAAEYNEEAARQALQDAAWTLGQAAKTAPAYSFVYDTLYRVGEYVPPGNPVIALLPPENIKVRFFVPQKVAAALAMGQRIHFSGPDGASTPASITYISPQPEFTPPVIFSRDTHSKLVYMVEADMDAETAKRLHPGQPVEVYL